MHIIIFLFILTYLAGSINFAILLFKLLGKEDPRNKFSGNPGTTNVNRQAGKFWAIVVLLLDFGRAAGLSALSLYTVEPEFAPVIGFALILGNRFPCFHGFRGGKGVANYLGFSAMLSPIWTAIAAGVWVTVYFIKKIPFIASIFMVLTLSAGTMITNLFKPAAVLGASITAILIIFNHKKNILEYLTKQKNEKS